MRITPLTRWTRVNTVSPGIKRWKPNLATLHFVPFLVVSLAVALGTCIRLSYVLSSDFPLNDGGLFYTMVQDLQANHYRIPAFTSYNNSGIPFAYPPLSFYLVGFLNDFFHFDLVHLFRFFPLAINIICIPVFYFLSKNLAGSQQKAIFATLAFAILKPGFEWLIMGGGITRSPAFLFYLLTIHQYVHLAKTKKKSSFGYILMSVYLSLCALSNLEIFWATCVTLPILFLFLQRSWQGLAFLALVSCGTGLLTSPYWIRVVNNHGISTFIYAFQSGEFYFLSILSQLSLFRYTEEFFLQIGQILALIGLFATLMSKNYLYIVWLLTISFLNPRSANRSLIVPVSLLIAVCIDNVIYPALKNLWIKNKLPADNSRVANKFRFQTIGNYLNPEIVVMLLFAQLFATSYLDQYMNQFIPNALSKYDREAMSWVSENTPADSKFVVSPGSRMWQSDPVSEWFPALTSRTNVFTVQGYEWTNQFYARINQYNRIVTDQDCTLDWAAEIGSMGTYVYTSTSSNNPLFRCMKEYHEHLDGYLPVYQNDKVIIYSFAGNSKNG